MCMDKVELKTIYRSTDEPHLVFLNRLRFEQPDRPTLKAYFGERHWYHEALEDCVARGMALAKEKGEPFSWLTCTNRGAAEVCEAALSLVGVTAADLAQGAYCDPTTKSELRIVAKPGILLRLSHTATSSVDS